METPDPRFPGVPADQIGDTVLLTDYVVEIAELLQTTEGHADPLVRATRKIVVQAAIALDHALATLSEHNPDVTNESTSTTEPEPHFKVFTKPERKASAAILLMQEHGITAAEVREWCRECDVEVSSRGAIGIAVVRLYVDNHTSDAA